MWRRAALGGVLAVGIVLHAHGAALSSPGAVGATALEGRGGAPATLDANANTVRALAAKAGVHGRPLADVDVPAPDSPIVRLGRELFFSKTLSGNGDVACASCHHPLLGGGDGLSLPVGAGAKSPDWLGPGRSFDWQGRGARDPHAVPGPNVARNSPTVFNVALYRKTLFHDGRLQRVGARGGFKSPESVRDAGRDLLAVQARLPTASEAEMRGFAIARHAGADVVRDQIVERLQSAESDGWANAFASAFGDSQALATSVDYARVEAALSDYQRSQMFVDSPWLRFVRGDDGALDEVERRGAALFFTGPASGGFGCVSCHAGDFFTDEDFHVLAMPQLGRGVERPGPGFGNSTVVDGTDLGRFEATRRKRDAYAFRTPTLLNVQATAPYGHAGSYATLEEVVRHHLDPARAINGYDWSLQNLVQFKDTRLRYEAGPGATAAAFEAWQQSASRRDAIEASDADVAAVVAFLKALTDPCVLDAVCLAPWIPPADQAPPDTGRLEARILAPTVLARAFQANR